MSYLLLFARCLIGLTFVVSAGSKVRSGDEFRAFAASLRDLAVLPERLVGPVAVVVVVAEAAVPVLLVPLPTAGLLLAATLLTAFTAVVATVLRRGVQASCRCFGGSAAAPFRRHHLVRNAVLAVVAAAGAYASLAGTTTDRTAILAVPPALVAALAVIYLDDLIALFAPSR